MAQSFRFGQMSGGGSRAQIKGHPLNALLQREGYHWSHILGGGLPWLMWGDATYDRPEAFDELFSMPDFTRRPHTGYATDVFPILPWLASDYIIRTEDGKSRQALRMQDISETNERHEQLKSEVADKEGCVPLDETVSLASYRDAIEKQLRRVYAKALGNLEKAREVLLVWFVEAERPIIEATAGFHKSTDAQRRESHQWLLYHAKELWEAVCAGAPPDHLKSSLDYAFSQEYLPEALPMVQKRGILHHVEKRMPLIESARPLDAQRQALEFVLKRALVGKPVMTEEELLQHAGPPYADESMQSSVNAPFSANAKWHRWGRFIINWCWRLETSKDTTTLSEQAHLIGKMLAEERGDELSRFGVDASDFGPKQLRRIIVFHQDTRFDTNG